MNEFNFGDVVLIQFPFTDSSETKKRPALIVKDTKDGDIIVNRITGKVKDTSEDIEINDWKISGLLISSTIRIHKIATISKKLIERKLGSLSITDSEKVMRESKRFWSTI